MRNGTIKFAPISQVCDHCHDQCNWWVNKWHHLPNRAINDLCRIFRFNLCQRDEDGNEHIKKLHTIVRIVLLSFVPTIIVQHFTFLFHGKFFSKWVFRISRDVDDRMWAKIKTPKIPWTKINSQKIPYRTTHHQDYSVKIEPTNKIRAKCFLLQKNPGI